MHIINQISGTWLDTLNTLWRKRSPAPKSEPFRLCGLHNATQWTFSSQKSVEIPTEHSSELGVWMESF